MKKQLEKLIDLKSIITVLLVLSLIAVIFCGVEFKDEGVRTLFISTTTSVVTYYFAKIQSQKTE
jgi:hypothetical protein